MSQNVGKLLVGLQEPALKGCDGDADRSLIEHGVQALRALPQGLGCVFLRGNVEKIDGKTVAPGVGANMKPGVQRRVKYLEIHLYLIGHGAVQVRLQNSADQVGKLCPEILAEKSRPRLF